MKKNDRGQKREEKYAKGCQSPNKDLPWRQGIFNIDGGIKIDCNVWCSGNLKIHVNGIECSDSSRRSQVGVTVR